MKKRKTNKPLIVIIDYGMGNIPNVRKAVESQGAECSVISSPDGLGKADAAILPGVGAFGQAMKNLKRQGFIPAIREFVKTGRPFLGVCLGQQLFFDSSEESFGVRGLSLLKGRVIRFRTRTLKVPHIGWNQVRYVAGYPLMKGVKQDDYFYFVHSYYAKPADPAVAACVTKYGDEEFASGVRQGNLFAFQFHPEKSQSSGLKIYRNFVNLARRHVPKCPCAQVPT